MSKRAESCTFLHNNGATGESAGVAGRRLGRVGAADEHRERFNFEPLAREHLSLLAGWLEADHVASWFGLPAAASELALGERAAIRRFIALRASRPIGLIQMYRWSDFPDHAATVGGRAGEVGIDYLIGETELIGGGVGPALIDAFLECFASGRGEVSGARVTVSKADERSWGCLEAIAFRREREGVVIPGRTGRQFVYVRDGEGAGVADGVVMRVVGLIRAAPVPLATGMRCRVLAIDGPGGAGRSTLAIAVARALGDAPVVHTDAFAAWDNPLDWHARLLDQVLRPLCVGAAARYQRYDWDARQLAEWHEIDPRDVLIIEGVGASRRALRPYLAASFWVQTNRAERLRRGLERDGPDALPLWEQWMRAEDEYIATERPDQAADLVVSGEPRRRGADGRR